MTQVPASIKTKREYIHRFDNSNAVRPRQHSLIPGGAHTYAKGDDQYPELSPAAIERGEGCHVWDIDGNEFIEYGMGLRAVGLGHAYKPVVEAAYQAMLQGANFVRPSHLELRLAEEMVDLFPGLDMVKFSKNGSDATSAAVKLARAYTGRDLVAVPVEHPFFSTDDWFIGATPMYSGIPNSIRYMTVKFNYNNLASVRTLFERYPNQIACVILEAATASAEPENDFLHELQNLCRQHGALLILDEMITGFRWHLNGAQRVYDIVPDMATFGKAMANGFSVSALMGKREIMELGGLNHDKERVFLLSTTHGGETHGLAACLETIRIYREEPVIEHMYRQGDRLACGLRQVIAAHQLEPYFGVMGRACNMVYFTRDQDQKPSQAFRALFLQETIKRGLLMPSLVVSYSHSDADIDYTVEAIDEALGVYRKALDEGVDKYLVGRPVKPVFRTRN